MRLPQDLPREIKQEIEKRVPLELLENLPEPPRESDEEMVAKVTSWVALIEQGMTSEAGQRRLRDVVRSCVHAGTLPSMQVIKAAERYRAIDMALREMIAEGLDSDLPELARTSLKAFQQQAVMRDITTDPPGNKQSNYARDIGIAVLLSLTMIRWPYLRKSQNRISKKTSASAIVAEALNRRHLTSFGPGRVVEIYDEFDQVAKRLSRLIPA
jgi:hypothetical protein